MFPVIDYALRCVGYGAIFHVLALIGVSSLKWSLFSLNTANAYHAIVYKGQNMPCVLGTVIG